MPAVYALGYDNPDNIFLDGTDSSRIFEFAERKYVTVGDASSGVVYQI